MCVIIKGGHQQGGNLGKKLCSPKCRGLRPALQSVALQGPRRPLASPGGARAARFCELWGPRLRCRQPRRGRSKRTSLDAFGALLDLPAGSQAGFPHCYGGVGGSVRDFRACVEEEAPAGVCGSWKKCKRLADVAARGLAAGRRFLRERSFFTKFWVAGFMNTHMWSRTGDPEVQSPLLCWWSQRGVTAPSSAPAASQRPAAGATKLY